MDYKDSFDSIQMNINRIYFNNLVYKYNFTNIYIINSYLYN